MATATVMGTATGTTTTSTTSPSTPRPDDGEIDGRAIRAAKDAEGRHDAGYYRTRDSVQPERPPAPEAEGDGGPRHPQLRRGPGPQRAL